MGHHLAGIDVVVLTDLDVKDEIGVLYLNLKLRERIKDKASELITDLG